MAEAGYPAMRSGQLVGLLAPAGTPADVVVETPSRSIGEIMAMPQTVPLRGRRCDRVSYQAPAVQELHGSRIAQMELC